VKELEEFDCITAIGNLRELEMNRRNPQKRQKRFVVALTFYYITCQIYSIVEK